MRAAFVVMPIKEPGSEDYGHFRALYGDVIKPALEEAGYESVRADDVQETGAVTKDIVRRLAEADLVVADLTDLNPNVFYELGIRHSLRGGGTIMMLDRSRTHVLPFDISPYRSILYDSDVAGIAKLRAELGGTAKRLTTTSVEHRDSPVHDAVPVLALNVPASAEGAVDKSVAEELASLRERLHVYEERYGPVGAGDAPRTTPLDVVLETIRKAEQGELLADLVNEAEIAIREREIRTFLSKAKAILSEPSEELAGVTALPRLARGAKGLGLAPVGIALLEAGTEARPHDDNLRAVYLGELAHSPSAEARGQARLGLLAMCGLSVGDTGDVAIEEPISDLGLNRLAVALDAYHTDDLHSEALQITSRVVEFHPSSTIAVRNHARALGNNDKSADEVESWYGKSIFCPDVDSQSARWFGSELYNTGRYVDALEVSLFGAKLDPDDIDTFVNMLRYAGLARREQLTGRSESERALPAAVDDPFYAKALLSGLSCESLTKSAHDLLRKYGELAEIDATVMEHAFVPSGPEHAMGYAQRYEFADAYYRVLTSDLTQQSALGPGPEGENPRRK